MSRRPAAADIAQPDAKTVEIEVDHRRCVEGEDLAQDQPTDDGYPEGAAKLAAIAEADGERESAEQGRVRCHHDRPKA